MSQSYCKSMFPKTVRNWERIYQLLCFPKHRAYSFLLYSWDTIAQDQSEKKDESKQENQELNAFRLSDTIWNRQLSKNRGHNLYVSPFITYVLNIPSTYSPQCLKHSIKRIKLEISHSYECERILGGKKGRKDRQTGGRKEREGEEGGKEREGERKGEREGKRNIFLRAECHQINVERITEMESTIWQLS